MILYHIVYYNEWQHLALHGINCYATLMIRPYPALLYYTLLEIAKRCDDDDVRKNPIRSRQCSHTTQHRTRNSSTSLTTLRKQVKIIRSGWIPSRPPKAINPAIPSQKHPAEQLVTRIRNADGDESQKDNRNRHKGFESLAIHDTSAHRLRSRSRRDTESASMTMLHPKRWKLCMVNTMTTRARQRTSTCRSRGPEAPKVCQALCRGPRHPSLRPGAILDCGSPKMHDRPPPRK